MLETIIAVSVGALCGWLGAGKTKNTISFPYLAVATGIIGGIAGLWLCNTIGINLNSSIIKAQLSSAIGAIVFVELQNIIAKQFMPKPVQVHKKLTPAVKRFALKQKVA